MFRKAHTHKADDFDDDYETYQECNFSTRTTLTYVVITFIVLVLGIKVCCVGGWGLCVLGLCAVFAVCCLLCVVCCVLCAVCCLLCAVCLPSILLSLSLSPPSLAIYRC